MAVQIVPIGNPRQRDADRFAELVRIVRRGIRWPRGNPGAEVRSQVTRVATLRLLAERLGREALDNAASIEDVERAERSVRRAELALSRAVSAARKRDRGQGRTAIPSTSQLMRAARNA